MEKQRELHGDNADVTFLGYQSHIHGALRMSDVAILPTRFAGESFPLSIIQALQVGKPVISTSIGQIAEMNRRRTRQRDHELCKRQIRHRRTPRNTRSADVDYPKSRNRRPSHSHV